MEKCSSIEAAECTSLLTYKSLDLEQLEMKWTRGIYLYDIEIVKRVEAEKNLFNIEIPKWLKWAPKITTRVPSRYELHHELREFVGTMHRRWRDKQEYPPVLKQKLGNVNYTISNVVNLKCDKENELFEIIEAKILPQFPFMAGDVLAQRGKFPLTSEGKLSKTKFRWSYEVNNGGNSLTTTMYNVLLMSYYEAASLFNSEISNFRCYILQIDLRVVADGK